jgi:hypothetical protein
MAHDDEIPAIPTTYKAVRFKSRLEARFAEWLDRQEVRWEYEPPHFAKSYTPDFFLPDHHLYVEVKPEPFIRELDVFGPLFDFTQKLWICVDKCDHTRDSWRIILTNSAFFIAFPIRNSHFSSEWRFDFGNYLDSDEWPLLRIYLDRVDLDLRGVPTRASDEWRAHNKELAERVEAM